MHELALAEGILSVVLEAAHGQPVKCVRVQAGEMQGIVQDSLRFAFEVLSEETPAKGATVLLENLPVRFLCKACKHETVRPEQPPSCGACGGWDVELLSGMEVIVDSIELSDGTFIQRQIVEMSESMKNHLREHADEDDGPMLDWFAEK